MFYVDIIAIAEIVTARAGGSESPVMFQADYCEHLYKWLAADGSQRLPRTDTQTPLTNIKVHIQGCVCSHLGEENKWLLPYCLDRVSTLCRAAP